MKALVLNFGSSSRLRAIDVSSASGPDTQRCPRNGYVTLFSSLRWERSFVNSRGVKYNHKLQFSERWGEDRCLNATLKRVVSVAVQVSLLFGSAALALGLLLSAVSAKENERSPALLSSSGLASSLRRGD